MKIFNWVHRRFVHKDGLGEKGKKIHEGDDVVVDADEKKKNGAFCGWKGGILTIGTFGYEYDPIILLEDDDDRDDQINHELDDDDASFIYTPKDHDEPRRRLLAEKELEQQLAGNNRRQINITENDYKLDVVITAADSDEEQPLLYAVYDHHDYYEAGLLEMKMEEQANKKERTTLADLFSADSELDNIINININISELMKKKRLAATINVKNMKEADDHVIDKMMTTLKSSKKSGHSFPNLDKARPIHKLHRLMRRMMKRKIHPAEINGGLTNYSKLAADFTESASLLSS